MTVAAVFRVLATVAFGCGGCGPSPPPHAAIYARVDREFAHAAFFKPADSVPEGLERDLAPLLLFEAPEGAGAAPGTFGTLEPSGDGAPRPVPATGPVLYFADSAAVVGGRERVQLVYVWLCRLRPGGPWAVQGVRITVDERFQPVVWEVLFDSSGARVIYVSARLEEEARKVFGAPLPGRRFAVERPLDACPDVVVARALTDGPVPMGPWVYHPAGGLDVSTLLCRCMPSQVEGVTNAGDYEVRPLDAVVPGGPYFPPPLSTAASVGGSAGGGDGLDSCLRLPPSF